MSDIFYIGYLISCFERGKIPCSEENFLEEMKKQGMSIESGGRTSKDIFFSDLKERDSVIEHILDYIEDENKDVRVDNEKDVMAILADFKNFLVRFLVPGANSAKQDQLLVK